MAISKPVTVALAAGAAAGLGYLFLRRKQPEEMLDDQGADQGGSFSGSFKFVAPKEMQHGARVLALPASLLFQANITNNNPFEYWINVRMTVWRGNPTLAGSTQLTQKGGGWTLIPAKGSLTWQQSASLAVNYDFPVNTEGDIYAIAELLAGPTIAGAAVRAQYPAAGPLRVGAITYTYDFTFGGSFG